MIEVCKCKKTFYVDKYDDDGFYTGKVKVINEGSIWIHNEEEMSMMIGGTGHIHLERDTAKGYEWIEISKRLFEECFEIVKEGEVDELF